MLFNAIYAFRIYAPCHEACAEAARRKASYEQYFQPGALVTKQARLPGKHACSQQIGKPARRAEGSVRTGHEIL